MYGGAELRLLPLDWLPGYSTWDVFVNRPLLLGAEFRYPLWQDDEKPILHLQGEVDIDNITGTASLEVQSDGKPFDTIPLTSRALNWVIPFYKAPISGEDLGLKFMFKGSTNDGQMLKIKVNRLFFEGMSPERMVTPVFVTENSCLQKGTSTLCEITLNQDAQIVQLPVLYYSQMLKVWVDNQRIQYFPVNHRDHNLVGLKLKPGTHKIRVTFCGLAWTNWISGLAWLGFIVMSVILFIQKKLKIKA